MGHALPQPVGKVIQPQPRSVETAASLVRREASNKPAWRNPAATVTSASKLDSVQNEFPTAAEVAQGVLTAIEKMSVFHYTCYPTLVDSAKLVEKKQAAQAAAAQKQAMAAEADAFRGVHLGPNVHHWDEVRV